MVSIRLARGGAKKRPFYHIVVADKRSPRDGRYIERLGFFNPIAKGQEEPLRLNIERVEYWIGCGAQPSNRVKQLIKVAKNPETYFEAKAKRQESKVQAKAAEKAKAEAEALKAAQAEAEAEAKAKAEAAAAEAKAKAEEAAAQAEAAVEEKAEAKSEEKAEAKSEEKAGKDSD